MNNEIKNPVLTVINATGGRDWPPGLSEALGEKGIGLHVASTDAETEALCRQFPDSVLVLSRNSGKLPPACAHDLKTLWLPISNGPGYPAVMAEILKLGITALFAHSTPGQSDSIFLSSLLAGMPFGLVVTQKNGEILYANHMFCSTTGYTSAELAGLNITAIRCPVGFGGNLDDALPRLSDGKPWIGEMETLHREGEKVYGQVIAYPIGTKPGEHLYNLLICTPDTTDYYRKKHAEQSASLETYGLLAGGIVHDFKNLLQGIGIYTDLLACEPAENPEIAAGFIQKMRQDVIRGQALLDNLMNFSQINADVPVPVALHDTMHLLVESLQPLIPGRILFQFHPEKVGKVRISSDDLFRILQNLLMNAVSAIKETGSITLSLKRRQTGPASGTWAEITVEDTGCGMDEATAARAFEPFFTTRRNNGGTGLGLAVVMSLTVKSGGFVDMNTRPGEGAVFRIVLPVISESI